MRKIKYLIFFNLSRKSTKTNISVCWDRLAEASSRKLVLDTLRARFLKLSLVDQVVKNLELGIELIGIVNQARNLGVAILFGRATRG